MSRLVHISEAASLAIHSLALIASSTVRLNAKKISEILHVSQNHLAKILQVLAKNEYLESNRGPGGGFTFKKNADQITMLEIYQLIEGNVECQFCGITENHCPFISCIFGGKPDKLTNEFVEYLTNTKISDLKTKDIKYA
ncbi:MAG: Rrf2 family transcriptional regulator [Bacteroidales bacterium]|nr:Rrf2 family transcriptional regulator [Bacteroidales bacterium]